MTNDPTEAREALIERFADMSYRGRDVGRGLARVLVELAEREGWRPTLPAPSVDEREALKHAIEFGPKWSETNETLGYVPPGVVGMYADAVLAAGFRLVSRSTPPEDVAAAFDSAIRAVENWYSDDERVGAQYAGIREGLIRGRKIALAARSLPETEDWEYARRNREGYVGLPDANLGEARQRASDRQKVVRRRPAGPWSPVPSADLGEEGR